MLGELYVGRGVDGEGELGVRGDGDVAPALERLFVSVASEARRAGLGLAPRDELRAEPVPLAVVPRDGARPDGYIEATPGGFRQVIDGRWQPYKPPATQAGELRALLGLRDALVSLLDAEAATRDGTAEMDRLRAQLNARYDAYVRRFGPVNRFSWRPTGRADAETGEPGQATRPAAQRRFQARTRSPLSWTRWRSTTQRTALPQKRRSSPAG